MRFKSLAAARNRVRKHPETRPAKSPRAPAAATPYFISHSYARIVSILVGQTPWSARDPPVTPPQQRSLSRCLPPFKANRIVVKGRAVCFLFAPRDRP